MPGAALGATPLSRHSSATSHADHVMTRRRGSRAGSSPCTNVAILLLALGAARAASSRSVPPWGADAAASFASCQRVRSASSRFGSVGCAARIWGVRRCFIASARRTCRASTQGRWMRAALVFALVLALASSSIRLVPGRCGPSAALSSNLREGEGEVSWRRRDWLRSACSGGGGAVRPPAGRRGHPDPLASSCSAPPRIRIPNASSRRASRFSAGYMGNDRRRRASRGQEEWGKSRRALRRSLPRRSPWGTAAAPNGC